MPPDNLWGGGGLSADVHLTVHALQLSAGIDAHAYAPGGLEWTHTFPAATASIAFAPTLFGGRLLTGVEARVGYAIPLYQLLPGIDLGFRGGDVIYALGPGLQLGVSPFVGWEHPLSMSWSVLGRVSLPLEAIMPLPPYVVVPLFSPTVSVGICYAFGREVLPL